MTNHRPAATVLAAAFCLASINAGMSRPAELFQPEGWNLRAISRASSGPYAQQTPPATPQRPAQPAQPARDRARATTGTAIIRGRVYAADTGAPLRRARVNWSSDVPAPATAGPVPAVMTDNEGRYEIRDLPAGRYRVYAKRTGYLQMDYGARRAGSDARSLPTASERGTAIDLADGQVFDRADFNLPRAGAITGRVLDEYGDPLISTFVVASRQQMANGRRRLISFASDMTDDQGEYRLSGLPAGSYYVFASPPAYLRFGAASSYADVFYPGVAARDQARAVIVRESQETNDVSFMLSPVRVARISGTVLTSRGTVPTRASFALERTTDTVYMQTTAYSVPLNASGGFTLSGINPGECDLVVTVQTDTGRTEVAVVHFSVTGDDVTGLLIATGAEGQVTGTVRTDDGGPLPGGMPAGAMSVQPARGLSARMRIRANAADTGDDGVLGGLATGNASSAGSVNGDGTFVAPVRPGSRVIALSGLPAGWGLVSVTSGQRNLTDVPVEVPQGSTLTVQVVVSNRLPEIAGGATDASERPTADYDVVLFPRDRSRWFPASPVIRIERPNQRGEFRVTGLRPGDYYVAAVQDAEDKDWTDPDALERLRPASAEVTVALGDKKAVRLKIVRAVM